jgi:hypothetical protein
MGVMSARNKTMKALKVLVAALLLSISLPLIGQIQSAPSWAACGDMQSEFSIKLNKSQHSVPPPDRGRARIVFIEDAGGVRWLGYPAVRVAIGGRWAGALKRNSYFSASIDPGEQHLCVATEDGHVALAHLAAETGKTYYYWIRISSDSAVMEYLSLSPVDSDEAAFQIGMFPMAISNPGK